MNAGAHHLRNFLEMLAAERGAAGNTLQAYTRDLGDFTSFLERRGKPVEGAGTKDIQAYLHHVSEAGLSAASRARRLSSIRQFYKFLIAESVISADPAAGHAR
jgi:integrase/recombinase XerD